jgi:adenosylcobinamide-GDP ribazoletransferase
VVGLFLGIMLSGEDYLLSFLTFKQFSADIILVVSLAVFTGGIHLDGLADTADAFFSRRKKEEMLEIMRDPHIGAMGVISIICVMLLKISFLASIAQSLRFISLILMCSLSRWILVFLMYVFPYARQDGKAKVLIQGINFQILFLASLFTIVTAIGVWGIYGIYTLAIIMLFAYLFGRSVTKKIGGITGDVLGAFCEITEIIALLCICITERFVHG